MQFLIATNKRDTLVTDGNLFGQARVCTQDTYDQNLGIKIAILNLYLRIESYEKLNLQGYPDYFMVTVPDAHLLEIVARAALDRGWYSRRQVVECWAPKIEFTIQAFGHTFEDLFEKA